MIQGWRVEHFASLASTSDHLLARARAGEAECLAVLADRQTAGRGRAGRSWLSPEGGLALSVLLRPATEAGHAGQWSLLAGLATLEALRHFVPAHAAARIRLKWPNDLVADGAKLAGILAESEFDFSGRIAFLVLGIGANLDRAPALSDRPAIALRALGAGSSAPKAVAAQLLGRLDHWRGRYREDGFAPIRAAWLAAAHPPGTRLVVRTTLGEQVGEFIGLDRSGALRLRTAEGERIIASGEIL